MFLCGLLEYIHIVVCFLLTKPFSLSFGSKRKKQQQTSIKPQTKRKKKYKEIELFFQQQQQQQRNIVCKKQFKTIAARSESKWVKHFRDTHIARVHFHFTQNESFGLTNYTLFSS